MLKSVVVVGVSLLMLATAGAAANAAGSTPRRATPAAVRPMFAVQPTPLRNSVHSSTALPTWSFGYKYAKETYRDVFVGADPSDDTSTTIPVYIIPVKMSVKGLSADPTKKLASGKSVVQTTTASPMFQNGIDFVQGGTDVGATQYTDAYERASLWGTVSSHTGYHVLLGKPTVEPKQTLKVPRKYGSTLVVSLPNPTEVIRADIDWYDSQIQPMLTSLAIPTNALAIFVTTQTYMTQGGGCCIGGYHSYTGTQAYADFSYIQTAGDFAQDVSALSHEVAEFLNDPFDNNNSPCGLYEVADPLEDTANFGAYPYTLGAMTYHVQDLATPVYFGAPTSTSVNGWSTFQGTTLSVCHNGA